MFTIKKSTAVIVAVLLISVFVYFGYVTKVLQERNGGVVPIAEAPATGSKKVSAEVKYMATEDKEDFLRFVLTLDKQGNITEVATLDAKTDEVPEKKKEFNEQLTVVIKGKKLSELSAIDKVGTSTLTTKAFNSVIDQMKAQL